MRKIVLLLLFLSTAYSMDFPFFKSDSSNDTEHVYLLHGLGRTRSAMLVIGARLKKAGFDFTLVGYPTLNKSTDKILAKVAEQINETLPDHKGTIHFVGHSLGGLMIRAYLENNQVDSLGKVVLMGTPNQGTVLVDRFRDKWWMKMLGPMTLSLGTDENSFPSSLADPYYPIGIIAANTEIIKNEKLIPGQDDGVVPVESTKLQGMTDFIMIKSGHATIRYNKEAANQTIEFLINGKFKHDQMNGAQDQ